MLQENYRIKYFGWSSLALECGSEMLLFDPFFRHYCGVQWSRLEDYLPATVLCVTHGHEEHFLDTPEILRKTGAAVVSSERLCRFLEKRNGIPSRQLHPTSWFQTVELNGFRITTFPWKHRDINLLKAMTKAVFRGNATQLKWAWSSTTSAPFYAPYVGFHVQLPDGTTVLNYNEGFNTKMTDAEIHEIRERLPADILLAGMQLHFVDDVARGTAALAPKKLILYPPHEKFHEMMGADSAPWTDFADAVRRAAPATQVLIAEPGMVFDA